MSLTRRAFLSPSALALVVFVVAAVVACGKPVGSEGGPCTSGGACDAGLTCASALCVRLGAGEGEGEGEGDAGEGEGEGEGCLGDQAATATIDDCTSIPTIVCAAADQNPAVATCKDAALDLRSGLFQAAFDCINAISTASCASLTGDVDACFGTLTACANTAAEGLCTQARDACVAENDPAFPFDACKSDLTPTNTAFRTAYADCFNASTEACGTVHESCYNTAVNALAAGG